MNAAERLRDALENSSILNEDSTFQDEEHLIVLRDAVRTIALPILEADSALEERIAIAIAPFVETVGDAVDAAVAVLAVLAAISTPTHVAGESL